MPEPGAIPTAAPPGPMLGAGPPGNPGGGGPSPMPSAPANVGAGVMPQGNPGNAVKGMSKVRQAIQLLESALTDIPMGSELHTELMNASKSLLKHMDSMPQSPHLDINTLMNHLRGQAQSSPMQALSRAFPQPSGGPPAMPGGAPPMAA